MVKPPEKHTEDEETLSITVENEYRRAERLVRDDLQSRRNLAGKKMRPCV